MDAHLRAGLAVYNAGDFHPAHDAWEDHWLDLESGTDDERFLHGLIQFTAAMHHAHERNWTGATGLAESALGYLDGLGEVYRGVDLAPVRSVLTAMTADPAVVERRDPPKLAHDGTVVTLEGLDFDAGAVAAAAYAEERGEAAVLDAAIEYAQADLAAGDETSAFVTFVLDYARDASHRGLIAQRLSQRVARREGRERDVEGLFD
jgi:hypothetical protein